MRLSIMLMFGMIMPVVATASPPSPADSAVPACFSLVGSLAGVPSTGAGQFTVVYRDIAHNPIAGATVVIDLSGAPDLHVCADQLDPDAIVDCTHKTVSKITAADGSVIFTLLGGSNGAGNASTLLAGGQIFANGTLIGTPTVSAYDLDGQAGVGANDLSAWLTDFGSGNPYGRSDYDCSGGIGANDLSFWLNVFGSGTMTSSCASSCP
jgi:hypothetical protein